jgi:hypothetical protein
MGNPMLKVFGIPALLYISLIYLPNVWIYVFMTADYLTPWKIFESPTFDIYHDFLLSRLTEREELPIPVLHANNFTTEDVVRLSKDYTFPIIIREVLVNSSGVEKWPDADWWMEHYKDEQILCGTLDSVRDECTIGDFFTEVKNGNPFYISGASKIMTKNPELAAMVEDDRLHKIEPGERVSTQIFMGLKDMGSDIHSAMGVNIFRQMVGRKKWWFIPPSQTPFLKPSINVNGFSAHTHTMVGKNGETESPWMKKIERYTAVLEPGDVLINPPWFWHGIVNQGESSNSLVVGVPTRYGGRQSTIAAVKSNPFMSLFAAAVIYIKYGGPEGFKNQTDILEDKINANRKARM